MIAATTTAAAATFADSGRAAMRALKPTGAAGSGSDSGWLSRSSRSRAFGFLRLAVFFLAAGFSLLAGAASSFAGREGRSISRAGRPCCFARTLFWRWVLRFLREDFFREAIRLRYAESASAPPMISMSSVVIAAWRARLYCRVSFEIISLAFFVAESIAVMRAPSSDAIDS